MIEVITKQITTLRRRKGKAFLIPLLLLMVFKDVPPFLRIKCLTLQNGMLSMCFGSTYDVAVLMLFFVVVWGYLYY